MPTQIRVKYSQVFLIYDIGVKKNLGVNLVLRKSHVHWVTTEFPMHNYYLSF